MKRYIHDNRPEGSYCIYYFYDHLLLRRTGEAEKVIEAVRNKDFKTFKEIFDKYPPYKAYDGVEEIFFPTTANLRTADGEFIKEVDITTPEGFAMIDEAEYECG